MRHLFISLAMLALAWTTAHAEISVPPPGLVVDQVGALSDEQRKDLEKVLITIREASHPAAIAILLIDRVPDGDIETYALTVGRTWKLGMAGQDNGLLMVYATGDHRYRFEVGPDLQGVLTDGAVGDIARQYFVPWVKTNNLHRAFNETIWAIAERLGNPEAVGAAAEPPTTAQTPAQEQSPTAQAPAEQAPAEQPAPPVDDTGFHATLAVMAAIIVLAVILRRNVLWVAGGSAAISTAAMVFFAQPLGAIFGYSVMAMLFGAFMVLIARNPIETLSIFLDILTRSSGGSSNRSSSDSSSSDSGSFDGGSFDGGGASGKTD